MFTPPAALLPLARHPDPVGFVQLRYAAPGWDDGLTVVTWNAAQNYLDWLENLGVPVADQPRVVSTADFPLHQMPGVPIRNLPQLVFMTGEGAFDLSAHEVAELGGYLDAGGTLLADAGSSTWGGSFRALVERLYPLRELRRIPDDDPLFAKPYAFSRGIDPLWNHDGRHAMGVAVGGRWTVIYHPGDMNDCFKDNAVRISEYLRTSAYQFMTNVVAYAMLGPPAELRKAQAAESGR